MRITLFYEVTLEAQSSSVLMFCGNVQSDITSKRTANGKQWYLRTYTYNLNF